MNTNSVAVLHRLVAMGSTSLLQYVNEAVPWSADAGQAEFTKVQALAGEERDHVAQLSRFLQKRHFGVPKIPTYPSQFTTINFVSIEYLVPKLRADNEQEIATIQGWLQQVGEDEGRANLESYLAMKQRHLQVLQELAAVKAA